MTDLSDWAIQGHWDRQRQQTVTVACAHARDRVGCPTAPVTVPGVDSRIADMAPLEGWLRTESGWLCPWCQTSEGIV